MLLLLIDKLIALFSGFQALLSVLKEQEPEINEVNDNLSLLMQQVDEKTPHATQVKEEVSQADQKQKDLIEKLNARKANLEEDVKHARVFQGSLADLEAWLPEAEERVSAQQPISTDPETVRKQLEEAQVGSNINDLPFLVCSMGERKRESSFMVMPFIGPQGGLSWSFKVW